MIFISNLNIFYCKKNANRFYGSIKLIYSIRTWLLTLLLQWLRCLLVSYWYCVQKYINFWLYTCIKYETVVYTHHSSLFITARLRQCDRKFRKFMSPFFFKQQNNRKGEKATKQNEWWRQKTARQRQSDVQWKLCRDIAFLVTISPFSVAILGSFCHYLAIFLSPSRLFKKGGIVKDQDVRNQAPYCPAPKGNFLHTQTMLFDALSVSTNINLSWSLDNSELTSGSLKMETYYLTTRLPRWLTVLQPGLDKLPTVLILSLQKYIPIIGY